MREMVRLCDICDFQGGSQPPKEEWSFEKKDDYIRMLQIRDFTQQATTVPEYIKKSKTIKTCQSDDVLIARYGASLGKILTGLSGAYNVAIMKTIPDTTKLEKKYLFYYLTSQLFQGFILNVGSRAAQAGFNKNDLNDLLIPLPPLPEQRHIAAVLDKVSELIALRKRQLDLLDEMVKARFVEMFGDPVRNEKGWDTIPLEKMCLSIVDCPHSTPNYTYENTGYMCIRTSIVKKNSIQWDKIEYISKEEYHERIKRKKPTMGDIIYTREGAILGIAAIIDKDYNVALGQRSMLLSPNLLLCHPQFICNAMNFDSFFNRVTQGVSGSASPHINVADIKAFNIILPPIQLQTQFATFIEKINKSKATVQQGLDRLFLLKSALMQEYFG